MAFLNPFKVAVNMVLAIPIALTSFVEEQKRLRKLEKQRVSTPPNYDEGVSKQEFLAIVDIAKREFSRIKSAVVSGFVVDLEIKSMSGITIWNAIVDFNDFGRLTGWYRVTSENSDSCR